MAKVLVGMSGGIDSAVTAYLLKQQGYEVEGISFLMWEKGEKHEAACCSSDMIHVADAIARQIGIGHDVLDVMNDFAEKVIGPFVQSYTSGLTPNPCILCNQHIKFPHLIKEAEKRGAEYIATGHYARVERQDSRIQGFEGSRITSEMRHQTSVLLKKGVDTKKDQSYVLYILTQDILNKLILPLGGYLKKDVREMGESFFPEAAERGESQEICFIQGKNYPDFIQEFVPGVTEAGPIIDPSGAIIGKHKGIYGYTIGQRRGLGIASPEPLYVAGIDIGKNIVYAGPRDSIKKKECHVHALNWIRPLSRHPAMSVGSGLKGPADSFRATVKVRSTMKDEPATIYLKTNYPLPPSAKGGREGLSGEIVRVVFDEPQWAPAPGQSAVFYDGDVVIGGGIIKAKS